MILNEKFVPLTQQVHHWIQRQKWPPGLIVDMTVGNGHDTLFLKRLFPNREILAIDIQGFAVETAYKRIVHNLGLEAARSIEWQVGCHSLVKNWLQDRPITLALYNLGYLPGSDKQVITRSSTTVASLEQLRPHVTAGGCINMILYSGHCGGDEERDAVLHQLNKWPQKMWGVTPFALYSPSAPQWVQARRKAHIALLEE